MGVTARGNVVAGGSSRDRLVPPRFAMRPSADMPLLFPWGMSGPFSP